MALRAPHLYQSLRAFCLAAFAAERGAELPFAFEEHPTRGGPSLYEYRPLVRELRRGAGADAAPAARHAQRDRGSPPRARGGDLRARALGPRRDRRRRALPHDPAADARPRSPSAAAASTGRTTPSRAPTPSIEQSLFGTRARTRRSRRSSGSRPGQPAELGGDIRVRAGRRRRDLGALARGARADAARVRARRRPALRARARPRARRRARASRPTPPASSPTPSARSGSRPPARSPPGPSSSSGSTSARSGSRRCCRSRRPSRSARRSGSTRCARGSPPTCASGCRSPTTTASSARRSTAGSSRSSPTSRSARARCSDALTALLGAGDGAWAAAMRAAVLLAGEDARTAPSSLAALRARARAARAARDALRRALVETLLHGNRARARRDARRDAARRSGRGRRASLAAA